MYDQFFLSTAVYITSTIIEIQFSLKIRYFIKVSWIYAMVVMKKNKCTVNNQYITAICCILIINNIRHKGTSKNKSYIF